MTHGTSSPQQQPSPALQAYAQAVQDCRTIGQQLGTRNCDDSPEWRAAETRANDAFDDAQAAGHSVEEIVKAGQKQ